MNSWTLLAFASLTLAAIPCGLFLSNLFVYRPLGGSSRRKEAHSENSKLETRNPEHQSESPDVGSYQVSVLIPARNEEASIRAAIESVLANHGVELELLVLDDHSTDRTAEIVRELAATDPRVRLVAGEPLPAGWCGKQFACHTLAQHARHPLLVFMDADVRLAPDALERMAARTYDLRFTIYEPTGSTRVNRKSEFVNSLLSGVPRQLTGTFLERLLIPLIHFVLLGFLPMIAMRLSRKEKFAAGCGQLFIAQRDAYFAAGGHATIRASLHDGVKLPRAFRRAGFRTDLFDATDLATCRMYQSNAETWRGLGKNATEGLGAPGVLPVMTALLFGGQVLPFLLLAALPWLPANAVQPTLAAALCAWIPRLIAARRFRQSMLGAILHPLGVTLLLVIQWQARWRQRTGAPMSWKGRDYPAASPVVCPSVPSAIRRATMLAMVCSLSMTGAKAQTAASGRVAPSFTMEDQFQRPQTLAFPRSKPVVLVAADQKGAEQINGWVNAFKARYGERIDYAGVANVHKAPSFLRGRVRSSFKAKYTYPVMLDWTGKACAGLDLSAGVANVIVLNTQGSELGRFTGTTNAVMLERAFTTLDRQLSGTSQPLSKIVTGRGSPRYGAPNHKDSGSINSDPVSKTPTP